MSRTFEIEVSERVVGWQRVTYTVDAEDFDDARDKYENGYADHYDSDGPDYWDNDEYDGDIEEVRCQECSEGESYCECCNDDYDGEDNYNPDYHKNLTGTIGSHEVQVGMWIVAADDYTKGSQFLEDQLVEVTKVDNISDDQKRIQFKMHTVDDMNYWYSNGQARFLVAELSEVPGLIAGREAARAEKQAEAERRIREREERKLVNELLDF